MVIALLLLLLAVHAGISKVFIMGNIWVLLDLYLSESQVEIFHIVQGSRMPNSHHTDEKVTFPLQKGLLCLS